MFQFSDWTRCPSELAGWKEWFSLRGIACEVRREGKFYALFREGEEADILAEEESVEEEAGPEVEKLKRLLARKLEISSNGDNVVEIKLKGKSSVGVKTWFTSWPGMPEKKRLEELEKVYKGMEGK